MKGAPLILLALALCAGCSQCATSKIEATNHSPQVVQNDRGVPTEANRVDVQAENRKSAPNAAADGERLRLHNLLKVSDRIYSGSQPEGEEGFASLAEMGVKTVVSVDGARPDLETARKYSLRYVHIPKRERGELPQPR